MNHTGKTIVSMIGAAMLLGSCSINIIWPTAKTIETSGEIITKTFDEFDFDSLKISNLKTKENNNYHPVSLNVHVDGDRRVEMKARESVFEYVSLGCDSSCLSILGPKEDSAFACEGISIDIYGYSIGDYDLSFVHAELETRAASVGELNVTLSGVSYMSATELLNRKSEFHVDSSSRLELDTITGEAIFDIDGASMVTIETAGLATLSASIDGASRLEAKGMAISETINVDGASKANLKDLAGVMAATANLDGASRAEITARNLTASLDGASKLTYYGDCNLTIEKCEGASIVAKGE